MSPSFPPSDRTRLRRRPRRGAYDEATIFGILDAGLVCHVGYVIDGAPFVTPTTYWRSGRRLFWHGAAASRMIMAQGGGLPVALAVTALDGIVLGRTGFTHSLLFRSVMAFGRAALVADPEEKRRAMHDFVDRLVPGRSRELRPIRQDELDAISVIAMTIEVASAKIRDGGVNESAEDVAFPAWAGIIPIGARIGRIVSDPRVTLDPPAGLAPYAENARLDDVLSGLAFFPRACDI